MKRFILINTLLYIFILLPIQAQTDSLSKSEMFQDIEYLCQKIDELHPDPFMRIHPDSFETVKNNVINSLSDKESINSFYFKAAPLLASLKDGHTVVLAPQFTLLESDNNLFPLELKLQKEKVFGVYNLATNDSLHYTEIESINGIPIGQIMQPILSVFPYDKTQDINYNTIEKQFFSYFNELYQTDSVYKIKFTNDSSTYYTPGISKEVLAKRLNETGKKKNYTLTINEPENTAVVKFRNFYPNKEIDHFIDSTFAVVNNNQITTMVFDIRDNTGGSSNVVSKILSNLTSRDFKIYDQVELKISQPVKEKYQKRDSLLYTNIEKLENGTLYAMNPEYINTGNATKFTGSICVLVNERTYSGAATFAYLVQSLGLGTVKGETGGTPVYFGDYVFVSLPHSKLDIAISTKKLYEYPGTTTHQKP